MPLDVETFGQGIYSPRQAARFLGTSPQKILRWTRGSGPTEPLWAAYYQPLDDTTEINFSDLIELRVVTSLRNQGVSLQAIRDAIKYASEVLRVERPLASLDFETDGSALFIHALENDGQLLSISPGRAGQKVFSKIIQQSLRGLEYEDGWAARWRPTKFDMVVLDPDRQFGSPVLDKFGVSTRQIYDDHMRFNDVGYLANYYDLPASSVRSAIKFEAELDRSDGQGIV